MPLPRPHMFRPQALSYRFWTATAVALALTTCGLIALSHLSEQKTLTRTEKLLARVREARVDLANGFLQLALSDEQAAPFRRETGLALLSQGIDDLDAASRESASPASAALAQDFHRAARQFRTELIVWQNAAPSARADATARLRMEFHQLNLIAERVDRNGRNELQEIAASLRDRFTLQISVALFLTAGTCAGAYFSARQQKDTFNALQESEERLRFLSDSLPDSFVYQYRRTASGEARFDYVSAGAARVHGLPSDRMVSGALLPADLVEPEHVQALQAAEAASARDLTDVEVDFWIRRPDGTRRLLHVRSRPHRLADGSVQWSGVGSDITERWRAQQAWEDQNTLLREMSAMARIGGWSFDPTTGEGDWTDEVARIHDLDPSAATSREIGLSVYHGESRARIESAIQAAIEGHLPYDLELEMVTHKGAHKWVRTQGEPVVQEGRVVRLRGALQDITRQRQAEAAQRESEARFRLLFEQAADGLFIVSPDGRYEDVNAQGLAMVGYSREELIGRTMGMLTHQQRPELLTELRSRVADGETVVRDWPLRRKDGSELTVEISVSRLSDGRMLSIVRDLTERKRAASRTAVQLLVTRALAHGAPLELTARRIIERCSGLLGWDFGAFWKLDRTTKRLRLIAEWNAADVSAGNWFEASRKLTFATGEGFPGRIWAAAKPFWWPAIGQPEDDPRRDLAIELGVRDAVGFPVLVQGAVEGVFEFYRRANRPRDYAKEPLFAALGTQIGQFVERQNLEIQIRQSQKMEALGTMAGGIAHDFNNILSAIILSASLGQMLAKGQPQIAEALDQIVLSGKRAADLVKQILTFSRRQEQKLGPVQLRHITAEVAKLLRATLPKTVEIEAELPTDLPPVLADATQVHQVLMNLGNNAGHAMRVGPGVLGISAETVDIDGTGPANLRPARYVRVQVSDTGHGMDAATCERIFEPFFTTKAPGEGTGLGLAVVHGIMYQLGGAITVDSETGVGTTFHLYFPIATDEAQTPHAQAQAPRGNGERILLIDDEPVVLESIRRLLVVSGYSVETRIDGLEALETLRAAPGKFDLVLTDLAMPRLSGVQLATEIRRLRLDLPVLLTSGNVTSLTEKPLPPGVTEVLPKPPTPEQLLSALHRLLRRHD